VNISWKNVLVFLGRRESQILFLAGLSIYLFTRLISLENFPVYFFTDEAAEQVRAAALWKNGFFDEHGHFLPVTAEGPWYRFVSIAHYIQMPGWLLFGHSITAVRGSAALLTAWAVFGLALILKRHFNCQGWWLAPLVMVTMPAWFLHSRTAFECVYTVVFYIWFCYFYLDYLSGKTNALYWASGFGALTLYSYSAGPLIMLVTSVLLLFSDFKHHLKHYRTVLKAFALSCLFLVPLLLFFSNYPDSPGELIQDYSLSLSNGMPFFSRMHLILSAYLAGFSHDFWFAWEGSNLRHRLAMHGHLLPVTAPLLYLGLALSLFHIKKPSSRLILILIAASSAGSAFVEPVITRNMTFLVPACMMIMIGGDFLLQRVKLFHVRQALYSAIFVLLGFYTFFLTFDSLKNGPRWFNNYGLYGLAWGSKEVIRDAIPEYLKQNPNETVHLSTRWMNSPGYLLQFFGSPENVKLQDYEYYIHNEIELPGGPFVVTHEQYEEIQKSPMVSYQDLGKIVLYPDGTPGFHFVRLKYSSDAKRLFKIAAYELLQLRESTLMVPSGETWVIRNCPLDIGDSTMFFDRNRLAVLRGAGGHPFVLEIDFPSNRKLNGVEVGFSQENILTAIIKNDKGAEIGKFSMKLKKDNPTFPFLRLDFKGLEGNARSVRLEMREDGQPDFVKVLMHVKEVTFY